MKNEKLYNLLKKASLNDTLQPLNEIIELDKSNLIIQSISGRLNEGCNNDSCTGGTNRACCNSDCGSGVSNTGCSNNTIAI